MDAYTDVVELCALLQCLGFSVKSLDMNDANTSQDTVSRTVIINCQSSGLHVVMEGSGATCSCPASSQQQTSGFWQVSGMAGGKLFDKESGSTLLGSLPKEHRERFTSELREMVRCIKEYTETDLEKSRGKEKTNKSASMMELKTPDEKHSHLNIKVETPTRYRSLDTLTGSVNNNPQLPTPGVLQKQMITDCTVDDRKRSMCGRQSTYTLSSTTDSLRRRNKTSSPIQVHQNSVLDGLLTAEKAAEDLRFKLSSLIRNYMEEGRCDSSMSSLVLDMSKISKVAETSKVQFSSSPNLSSMETVQDAIAHRLKRLESASTSNLVKKLSPKKPSRFRRLSPSFFKSRKENAEDKADKIKNLDNKNKVNSLLKTRMSLPNRLQVSQERSPNLSASKKKFSHIKSTIPRPTPKKE